MTRSLVLIALLGGALPSRAETGTGAMCGDAEAGDCGAGISSATATATATAAATATIEKEIARRIEGVLPGGFGLVRVVAPSLDGEVTAVAFRSAARIGLQSVLLAVRTPSGEHGVWAQVELRRVHPALVARRALRRGEKIAEGDLTRGERVAEGDGFAPDPAALVGRALVRDVEAGRTLQAADLDARPPIARGTPVRVVVRRGNLEIAAAGLLERPAHPGERSAARLTEGQHVVTGRLVDASTLLVERELP